MNEGVRSMVISPVVVWKLFFVCFFWGGGALSNMKAILRLCISENKLSLWIYYVYIEVNSTSRLIWALSKVKIVVGQIFNKLGKLFFRS